MNFRTQKISLQFFCIRNCTFGHEFPEKLWNRGGNFRSEKFRCKFIAGRHELLEKSHHFSRKRGKGKFSGNSFLKLLASLKWIISKTILNFPALVKRALSPLAQLAQELRPARLNQKHFLTQLLISELKQLNRCSTCGVWMQENSGCLPMFHWPLEATALFST